MRYEYEYDMLMRNSIQHQEPNHFSQIIDANQGHTYDVESC